jgi:ABC-type branched-subunit amino acid transport system ATPase component
MTIITFSRLPDTPFELTRVNVILGANGAGKSKALVEIKGQVPTLFPGKTAVFIEGGRAIKLPASFKANRNNFSQYETLSLATTTHKGKTQNGISDRITDTFMLLDRKGEELTRLHSDAVTKWMKDGKNGDCPEREEPPLSKLCFLFSQIFPQISLEFNHDNKSIICVKNGGNPYSLTELSDGEKQVLSILADIGLLTDEKNVILVDEPELNLNPLLACRLWEEIENDLKNTTFIYCTHCISFTMRENVKNILLLGNSSEQISKIGDVSNVPLNELRELLGTIPAILSTSKALVVEGHQNSFDAVFYDWLLGEKGITVVPMESSSDVKAVSSRTGLWSQVTSSVVLHGVVDRDFKPDSVVQDLEASNCTALELHEAESYLCIPEVLVNITNSMGLLKELLTITEVENKIIANFQSCLLKVVAKRVFEKTNLALNISITKSELANISNEQELKAALCSKASEQVGLASDRFSDELVKDIFDEEFANANEAINSRNILKILKIGEGKQLLSTLATLTGARNMNDLLRAATKHLKIENFLLLSDLRAKILNEFEDN